LEPQIPMARFMTGIFMTRFCFLKHKQGIEHYEYMNNKYILIYL
jgi:hypothetical protein